uniref:Ig-like domain-containing protein n=1 Tax=Hucho hucho TaxID=62062 RepID=A0A4W5JWA9_9TELE
MDRRQRESADGLCPVPGGPEWVSLLSAPIGTTQYLMCSIEDLAPNKVTVTGKQNDMQVEGLTHTVGKQPSGLYSASSLLKVTNTDWNNKVKYSCVVQHTEQTITKTISKTGLSSSLKCPAFTLLLSPFRTTDGDSEPTTCEEVFLDNQAVLECVITGTDQDTVSGTNITWQVNGQEQTDHIDLKRIESKGNLNSTISILTIDQTEWTNVNKVHVTFLLKINPLVGRAPSVSVHLLPEEDTKEEEIVTLVCLVVSPFLCDVYIMWTEDSGEYQEGVTSPPQKTPDGNYSVTSVFTTTKDKWKRNVLFPCSVKHAGSDNNTVTKERSVSKSMGNSCEDKTF